MRGMRAGIVAALLAGATPASATGDFAAGNWKGAAFFKDQRFTHCAMLQTYISGWRVLFSVDQTGEISLGLFHNQLDVVWSQILGQKSEVLLQVDDTAVERRAFTAISAHQVVTKFPPNAEWLRRLRKGDKLKINTGKRLPQFSLADIDSAPSALLACQAKYKNA